MMIIQLTASYFINVDNSTYSYIFWSILQLTAMVHTVFIYADSSTYGHIFISADNSTYGYIFILVIQLTVQ